MTQALQETSQKQPVPVARARTNFRWVVMAFAFFITIVNYMDRSAISYAAEPIKAQFHLTDSDLGMVFGAFGIGYIVSTLLGGILVDKAGARQVWSAAAVAWSCMTAMLGIVSGLWPLAAVRTALGVTEGPSFPSLTRVVADWLPLSERVRSTAFGLVAVPLASVIGAPLISTLIMNLGWQMMFMVLGSLGVIWAVFWIIIFRDLPEQSPWVSAAELKTIRTNVAGGAVAHHAAGGMPSRSAMMKIFRNPALMSNNYAFFAFGYLLFFAIHWLPEYLHHTFGLPLKQIGWLLVIPWSTAAVMLVATGFLCDAIWKKTGSFRASRSHVIWICQLLSALCLLPVVFAPSLTVAIFFMSLGLGFGLAPNAAFYALNADLAGDRAATSLGIMASCTAGAAVIAPWLTGMLKQATGNFNSAILLMIFFSLTAVLAVVLFQHPDRFVPSTRRHVS